MCNNKSLLLLFLYFFVPFNLKAKDAPISSIISNTLIPKIRYLEFGIGIPSIYFRDNTSSSLAYKGIGILALHFAGSKQKFNKMYKQWDLNFRIQNAKPDIENVTKWNKSANIYALDFRYRKLKEIKASKANPKRFRFFGGGSIGNDLQMALIPSANNTIAYNFSWLQLSIEGMIQKFFTFKHKQLHFSNKTSIPIFGINVRPLSYVGLPPQEIIWSQDKGILASLFKNPKLSSLNNNIALKNEISLDFLYKKSKLGLLYNWQYQRNTVSVNRVSSIVSSISLTYSFKLKDK